MNDIQSIVAQMVGHRCEAVSNPYGSILSIEIGDLALRPGSPPGSKPHGFRHLTIYSPWRLEDDHAVLLDWNVDGGTGGLIQPNIQILVGRTVISASTSAPAWDLRLNWTGGLRLVVFGDATDNRDDAWFILGSDGAQAIACPILRQLRQPNP